MAATCTVCTWAHPEPCTPIVQHTVFSSTSSSGRSVIAQHLEGAPCTFCANQDRPVNVDDMELAHAQGLHDGDDRREFCPECER
jgi:hypothetical protein